MLVYDVSDVESFCNIESWFDEIHMHFVTVSRDVLHFSVDNCYSLYIIIIGTLYISHLISAMILSLHYCWWVTKVILKMKDKSALRWVGRWVCQCLFCILKLGYMLATNTWC